MAEGTALDNYSALQGIDWGDAGLSRASGQLALARKVMGTQAFMGETTPEPPRKGPMAAMLGTKSDFGEAKR